MQMYDFGQGVPPARVVLKPLGSIKADGEAIRRFLNVTNVSCSQVQVRWTTSKILVC